jgi:hypothetical protein
MPIKFRCSYCRQFLGISRGRAGDIVDCPTCGRSIRVPSLDGVVAPLPSPETDRRDAKLDRALEELARWDESQPVPAAASARLEEEEIPQPIAEPIPIEVPVPPEPIAVKPPPTIEAAESPPSAGGEQLSVSAAIDELARISPEEAERRAVEAEPSFARRRRQPLWWLGALFVAAVGFAGGYFAGRSGATATNVANGPDSVEEVPTTVPAIAGRITYKTAEGESLPDRGARVLVLPREREGTAKLSPVGFRAADHPADVRMATAALRSLGGDVAVADDGGRFSVDLPNPGTFLIVVISNYAQRDGGEEAPAELLRQLAPYFEQPAQVLGRTKVHSGQVRYKGTGTEAWDHSF